MLTRRYCFFFLFLTFIKGAPKAKQVSSPALFREHMNLAESVVCSNPGKECPYCKLTHQNPAGIDGSRPSPSTTWWSTQAEPGSYSQTTVMPLASNRGSPVAGTGCPGTTSPALSSSGLPLSWKRGPPPLLGRLIIREVCSLDLLHRGQLRT